MCVCVYTSFHANMIKVLFTFDWSAISLMIRFYLKLKNVFRFSRRISPLFLFFSFSLNLADSENKYIDE